MIVVLKSILYLTSIISSSNNEGDTIYETFKVKKRTCTPKEAAYVFVNLAIRSLKTAEFPLEITHDATEKWFLVTALKILQKHLLSFEAENSNEMLNLMKMLLKFPLFNKQGVRKEHTGVGFFVQFIRIIYFDVIDIEDLWFVKSCVESKRYVTNEFYRNFKLGNVKFTINYMKERIKDRCVIFFKKKDVLLRKPEGGFWKLNEVSNFLEIIEIDKDFRNSVDETFLKATFDRLITENICNNEFRYLLDLFKDVTITKNTPEAVKSNEFGTSKFDMFSFYISQVNDLQVCIKCSKESLLVGQTNQYGNGDYDIPKTPRCIHKPSLKQFQEYYDYEVPRSYKPQTKQEVLYENIPVISHPEKVNGDSIYDVPKPTRCVNWASSKLSTQNQSKTQKDVFKPNEAEENYVLLNAMVQKIFDIEQLNNGNIKSPYLENIIETKKGISRPSTCNSTDSPSKSALAVYFLIPNSSTPEVDKISFIFKKDDMKTESNTNIDRELEICVGIKNRGKIIFEFTKKNNLIKFFLQLFEMYSLHSEKNFRIELIMNLKKVQINYFMDDILSSSLQISDSLQYLVYLIAPSEKIKKNILLLKKNYKDKPNDINSIVEMCFEILKRKITPKEKTSAVKRKSLSIRESFRDSFRKKKPNDLLSNENTFQFLKKISHFNSRKIFKDSCEFGFVYKSLDIFEDQKLSYEENFTTFLRLLIPFAPSIENDKENFLELKDSFMDKIEELRRLNEQQQGELSVKLGTKPEFSNIVSAYRVMFNILEAPQITEINFLLSLIEHNTFKDEDIIIMSLFQLATYTTKVIPTSNKDEDLIKIASRILDLRDFNKEKYNFIIEVSINRILKIISKHIQVNKH